VLARIGGLEALVESLADDYEMGARIAAAGYRVELADEVVETTVPSYTFRGFWEHQMRWGRSTRDSRKWGYLGLGTTYAIPWAVATVVASGLTLWSFSLLSLVLLARVAVALSVGVGILRDGQVLRDLWLLPVRDFFGLAVWAWSFAGDTVVWRGERFRLRDGRLERV
jgi:ceramide glucosyltransferase